MNSDDVYPNGIHTPMVLPDSYEPALSDSAPAPAPEPSAAAFPVTAAADQVATPVPSGKFSYEPLGQFFELEGWEKDVSAHD